jgi:hypothetical protein
VTMNEQLMIFFFWYVLQANGVVTKVCGSSLILMLDLERLVFIVTNRN